MTSFQMPDYSETKRILAGIVQESGGRFRNKTNLFKAYYWAHRFYREDHPGLLTRAHGMVRMPNGPGIDNHDTVLKELASDGLVTVLSEPWGDNRDRWVFESRKQVELTPEERDSIHRAIARVGGLTAAAASDDVHEESRSWKKARDGESLDIYLDATDDEEYARRQKLLDEAQAELERALKKA